MPRKKTVKEAKPPNQTTVAKPNVEVKDLFLLPAAPGRCPQCADDHDHRLPHNQRSLFWQYWFYGQHQKWPTWEDAMEHCSDDVKNQIRSAIARYGERGFTLNIDFEIDGWREMVRKAIKKLDDIGNTKIVDGTEVWSAIRSVRQDLESITRTYGDPPPFVDKLLEAKQ